MYWIINQTIKTRTVMYSVSNYLAILFGHFNSNPDFPLTFFIYLVEKKKTVGNSAVRTHPILMIAQAPFSLKLTSWWFLLSLIANTSMLSR
jgi:hypothetical protein